MKRVESNRNTSGAFSVPPLKRSSILSNVLSRNATTLGSSDKVGTTIVNAGLSAYRGTIQEADEGRGTGRQSAAFVGKKGVRGYSQDELDQAFSERDDNWPEGASIRKRFIDSMSCVDKLGRKPVEYPLSKTGLRNQADFYSFVTAVSEMGRSAEFDCSEDVYVERLTAFLSVVGDDEKRAASTAAREYFKAARSNSNDTGPRKQRHDVILHVLRGAVGDYALVNTEQIQGN